MGVENVCKPDDINYLERRVDFSKFTVIVLR